MTTLCEASPSISTPLLLEAAVATPPSSSSMLAPGFRFHPTDEELVSYYLKRKVKGLPLRVDAIAEVDLYKREPWELPYLSRLRTGDKEWYFFGALDRKYVNRSRTNRATAKGYWKTTGKDRPVRNASKVVGMKKTLVFHEGRAPHGKRTNWVMHEYRLEDESLSPDLPQGSFVVCKVFEKTGSGPQNGAQYGAPFVEEEWEAIDELAPLSSAPPDATFMDTSRQQDYMHPDDYEQKQVLVDQHGSTAIVVAEVKEEDIGEGQSEGPTFLLEELLDLDAYTSEPGLQDDRNIINNVQESSGIQEQSHSPSGQNDGYLELNDISDNVNMDYPSSSGLDGMDNDHIIRNSVNRSTPLPKVEDTELLFDIPNGTSHDQGANQMYSPTDLPADNYCTPAADDDYISGQLSEDNIIFYDALSNEPLFPESTNDLQFSPAADVSGFDMVDELMAYFDATENNLQSDVLDTIGNLEYVSSAVTARSDSVPEVGGSSHAPVNATLQVPETCTESDTSPLPRFVSASNQLKGINEDYSFAPVMQSNDGWNTVLKNRVVNMLGSIPAPPAMAEGSAKGKAVELLSTAHSSSSIRVSAGMIQIHGSTVIDSAEHWTLQKNGDTSFFLSYGIAPNDFVGKSACFEPVPKMRGGASMMLIRSGLYLFGISVLILSVSFKVGMCVYNK